MSWRARDRSSFAQLPPSYLRCGVIQILQDHLLGLMNMNVEIYTAVPEDAPDILSLQCLAYQSEAVLYNDWAIPPLTQTLEELNTEFHSSRILKAIGEGKLIGSFRAKMDGNTCSIGRLIVHPHYQLMTRIEELHPSALRFELFTGSLSDGNIRLYKTLGYQPFQTSVLSSNVTFVHMEKMLREE